MLRNSVGAAALLATLSLPGLALAQARPAPPKSKPAAGLPASVVARVNNQNISKAELVDLLNRTGARETVRVLVRQRKHHKRAGEGQQQPKRRELVQEIERRDEEGRPRRRSDQDRRGRRCDHGEAHKLGGAFRHRTS